MQADREIALAPSAERLADGLVQCVNVVLAVAGCVALGVLAGTLVDNLRLAALAVYGGGLLSMVGCSALYAWGRGSRRRTLYRHLDHAAIFLMIAGTYTPFTVVSLDEAHGLWLLVLIWSLAVAGVLLKVTAPRRFEPLSLPLYLAMGWAVLTDPAVLLNLPSPAIVLLIAGGVIYTAGIAFHLARMRFQEAIWHSFVLVAAACHYAAIVFAVT